MKYALVIALVLPVVICSSLSAQTFLECADLNEDGRITSADVVWGWNYHLGILPLPTGKGDVDFRAGFTIGDTRYTAGYVFFNWPEGGCPPFTSYPLLTGDDTLYLPSATVPAGSGELALPIIMVNHNWIADILLPVRVSGLDGTIFFDSLVVGEAYSGYNGKEDVQDSTGILILQDLTMDVDLSPGVHVLAMAHFHYTSSPGGTITMDTTTLRPGTILSYVYDDQKWLSFYDDWTIGIPNVVITNTVALYPTMSVSPDTLYFEAIAGNPDPAPQSFTILTDGAPFSWTLTPPAWLEVDRTSGVSGESVTVTPHIDGLSIQTHVGAITIESEGLGSPLNMMIHVTVRQAFPTLDANCDGVQDLADVITLVNYILRGAGLPCDPCTGAVGAE